MIRIAVIADPHVHDCTWRPEGTGLPGVIRSFAQTAASTRVFNESVPAFRAALDRAAQAGAKIVLLAGDLTDDGQRPNIRAGVPPLEGEGLAGRFAILLRMMRAYLDRQPNRDFALALPDLGIMRLQGTPGRSGLRQENAPARPCPPGPSGG